VNYEPTPGISSPIAFLFNTNGTRLLTITHATPASGDYFGASVAWAGGDRFLMGALGADLANAYLYDVSGRLLGAYTNPFPPLEEEEDFGKALAAVGPDKVLIGIPGDSTWGAGAGMACLFSAGGGLLATYTNPAPTIYAGFGSSVAAPDANTLLIGAPSDTVGGIRAGAVYVYSLTSYLPGLAGDGALPGSITTPMLATGSVTTDALADEAVSAAKVATVLNFRFALTLNNPTPAASDSFGYSVAAVGSERVLIGAPDDDTGAAEAGAAYLFSTDGTLLTTFINPIPAAYDLFGISVAAVGSDRVLIGAYLDDTGATDAGAAYLFRTDGALWTTFTNPTPAASDRFGSAVAAVGSDRVLIGAYLDDTGATDAGAAYLFSTNGTLLTTFTNPTPLAGDHFGSAVAGVGRDRVLIGALYDDTGATDAGAAYLFSTDGTLLTTFTNPTPATDDRFGWSVAAVGSDRVLIGADFDDTGASAAGAAYLFSTNGTLLTTFTNPTPATDGRFGCAVAAVGSDRVLIGAYGDNTGAAGAGAAYLFSTNGTLLITVTNPTPAADDHFGCAVAAVGSHRVLIGAWGDDTGAATAGAAYLFSLDTYTPGLVAEAVHLGGVTADQLDPAIGVWTRAGTNVYRLEGRVGIGTANPGFTLHVHGTAGKPGGGSWSVASDARLKKNIRPLAGVLDKLLALRGVNFEYADPAAIHELSGERMGLIAQEVERVFPDWVETGPDGYKRVTVRGLEALVVEGLRELQQKSEVGSQKSEASIRKLQAENGELKQEMAELKALVKGLGEKANRGAR